MAPGSDELLFTSSEGRPLRSSNFNRRAWAPALRTAGLPAIHFHDLRHTGNQLAAAEGANLRELMDRMGHSTARAVMVYLHANSDRQQAIAAAMSKRATGALDQRESKATGTQRARRQPKAVAGE